MTCPPNAYEGSIYSTNLGPYLIAHEYHVAKKQMQCLALEIIRADITMGDVLCDAYYVAQATAIGFASISTKECPR